MNEFSDRSEILQNVRYYLYNIINRLGTRSMPILLIPRYCFSDVLIDVHINPVKISFLFFFFFLFFNKVDNFSFVESRRFSDVSLS